MNYCFGEAGAGRRRGGGESQTPIADWRFDWRYSLSVRASMNSEESDGSIASTVSTPGSCGACRVTCRGVGYTHWTRHTRKAVRNDARACVSQGEKPTGPLATTEADWVDEGRVTRRSSDERRATRLDSQAWLQELHVCAQDHYASSAASPSASSPGSVLPCASIPRFWASSSSVARRSCLVSSSGRRLASSSASAARSCSMRF